MSLSQMERRKTPNHAQRMKMERASSNCIPDTERQHPAVSAQDQPIQYTILQSVKGGQSNREIGICIGKGQITVEMTPPMMVLKMERRQPIIVADLELLMNIWMKLVRDICAIAHPINNSQRRTIEVCWKKAILITYFPKMYILREVIILRRKLTMKKLIQQCLVSRPFIFIIQICLSYFSDTTMYSRIGTRRDRPRGQRPEPITFTAFSTREVSQPENGMYMYEPAIICFYFCQAFRICKQGRVILSTKDINPSVTLRQVPITPLYDVFISTFVTPLFLWYSGSRKSFIDRVTASSSLLEFLKLTNPSGSQVLRSSPLSKDVTSASFSRAIIAQLADYFMRKEGLKLFSLGQQSFSCILMIQLEKEQDETSLWKQQSSLQVRFN